MAIQTIRRSGLVAICLVASAAGLAGAQEQSGWTGGAPRPLLSPSSDATQEAQPSDPFATGRVEPNGFWPHDESAGFVGNLDEWFGPESDTEAADESWPDEDLQTQDLSGVLTTGEDEVYPTTAPSTEQAAEQQPSGATTTTASDRTSPIYTGGAPRSTPGRISGGRGGVTVTGSSAGGGGGGSGGGHTNFSLGSSGGGGSASASYGGGGGSGGVTGRPSGKVVTAGSSSGSVNVVSGGTSSSGTISHGQSSGGSSIVTGNAPVVNDPTAIDRGRNEHTDESNGGSSSAGSNTGGVTVVGGGSSSGATTGSSSSNGSSSSSTQTSSGSGSSAGSSGGSGGVVGGYPTQSADLLTPYRPTLGRVVAWMTVGGSGVNPTERNIGRNLKIYDEGWAGYIRRFVRPQLDYGCRRYVLHNPFGTLGGEVMQLDQLLQARQAGLTWLERDFVSAWKTLIDQRTDAGDPIEVIAYFGTPAESRAFVTLYEAGDRAGWLRRAWQSIQPAVDAGMSVALDMAIGLTKDHPAYDFVQQLKARGVRVYLEGIPSRNSIWLDDNIILEQRWFEEMPLNWSAKAQDIRGELMVILQPQEGDTWTNQKWVYGRAREYLVEHDVTVATSVYGGLAEFNHSLDELFDSVARARSLERRPMPTLE